MSTQSRHLQFSCVKCAKPLFFGIFDLERSPELHCEHCLKRYVLDDPQLLLQLKKFVALCRQLVDSQEILSDAGIGVDVGSHQVKIPFKILLTRLNSYLDLKVGNVPLTIKFRIEPLSQG